MGVYSGKFGAVDGISTVRQWNINDSMQPQRYAASNTRWGKGSQPGVNEWSGGFSIFGHTSPVMPGDQFSFLGYTAPNDGISGAGIRYSGEALVQQLQLSWNFQGGEILNGQVSFNGHLDLAIEPTGAAIDDVLAPPTVPPIVNTKIQLSSAAPWTTFEDWTNVAQAQLTISCELKSFTNSSTIIDGELWTGQRAGNIDWSLSITEHDISRSKVIKGQRYAVRLYVNDTDFYEIRWVQVNEFTGLTVNRESGDIMQQSVNMTMDGFDTDAAPGDAVGALILPDESIWWPPQPVTTTV